MLLFILGGIVTGGIMSGCIVSGGHNARGIMSGYRTDGRTETGRQQRPRSRIASRGNKRKDHQKVKQYNQ